MFRQENIPGRLPWHLCLSKLHHATLKKEGALLLGRAPYTLMRSDMMMKLFLKDALNIPTFFLSANVSWVTKLTCLFKG